MTSNVRQVRVGRLFQFNFVKTLFFMLVMLAGGIQLYEFYKFPHIANKLLNSFKHELVQPSSSRPPHMNPLLDPLYNYVKADGKKVAQAAKKQTDGEGKQQRFPDFIIIGMQKCGTTALQFFLRSHPQLKSAQGEMHFFERDYNYVKGHEYYMSQMPFVTKDEIVYEKTPDYMWDPRVPGRIKKLNPNLKFVAVICDPVHRIFSHYLHATLNRGRVNQTEPYKVGLQSLMTSTFEEVVEGALNVVLGHEMTEMLANADDEDVPKEEIRQKWHKYMDAKTRRAERTYFPTEILTRSSYGYLLDHWFRYFPKRNFLLIDADDIKHNPAKSVKKVQDFIGVKNYLSSENFEVMPDTGMYCLRVDKDSDCKIPGGNKGRTANRTIPAVSEKQLKRFFSATEIDNQVLDKTYGSHVYPFSWSNELLNL